MKVWYLAHPIAPDDRYTFEQNMEHIVEYTKFFWEQGVNVIAPYHTLCHAVPDDNGPNRERGLLMDEEVVKRIGRILLVGHKLSRGMKRELDVFETKTSDCVAGLVGANRKEMAMFFDAGSLDHLR